MKQVVIGLAVALIVILGAYLLVRPTQAPQTSPAVEVSPESTMTATPEATVMPSPMESGATMSSTPAEAAELKVALASLRFTPSSLTIMAGKPYKLTLVSSGPHTYTIDKLGINFVVAAGETKTFDLLVAKKGTYGVYCATPGHKEAGMVGTLVVQ